MFSETGVAGNLTVLEARLPAGTVLTPQMSVPGQGLQIRSL